MDLFTMIEATVALAEGVRGSADVPADEMSAARKAAAALAIEHGVLPERAAEIADETERAIVEFADALIVARNAARKINAVAEKHAEELRSHAQAE